MFFNFKCTDIDKESRLDNDLEVKCWEGEH